MITAETLDLIAQDEITVLECTECGAIILSETVACHIEYDDETYRNCSWKSCEEQCSCGHDYAFIVGGGTVQTGTKSTWDEGTQSWHHEPIE